MRLVESTFDTLHSESDIPSRANERQLAMWSGKTEVQTYNLAWPAKQSSMRQERRLRWAVIPQGCILGNSVNHIEMNQAILNRLAAARGDLQKALEWMCNQLNQRGLDDWAKAWSANNNVTNYELEMLPLELGLESELKRSQTERRFVSLVYFEYDILYPDPFSFKRYLSIGGFKGMGIHPKIGITGLPAVENLQ